MLLLCFLAILIQFSFCSKKQDFIFEIFNALYKTIDYMVENKDQIDLQGYFGIIRSKALLKEINLQRLDYNNALILLDILRKIDIILNMKYSFLKTKEKWVIHILNPNLWQKQIHYKYLKNECLIIAKNETLQLISQLSNEAETGCITPDMFEYCITNMYDTLNSPFPVNLHGIENSCKYFMLNNYYGIGYETTHKLLYIQILGQWRYDIGILLHKSFKENICSKIYKQASATMGRGPFFDLFLEQIFICGVEGYIEFLNMNWLKIILNNQLPDGCFSVFERRYRANFAISKSCSDHATGLAMATLSLHVYFHSNFSSAKEYN